MNNKLAYEVNGKIEYLPAWYSLKSDKEIEETKRLLIEEAKKPAIHHEPETTVIDEVNIRKQLKAEFTKSQIDEIIEKLYCGYTLDSAMQSVMGV